MPPLLKKSILINLSQIYLGRLCNPPPPPCTYVEIQTLYRVLETGLIDPGSLLNYPYI